MTLRPPAERAKQNGDLNTEEPRCPLVQTDCEPMFARHAFAVNSERGAGRYARAPGVKQ